MSNDYPRSYYAASAKPGDLQPFPMLTEQRDADVCVIGGGITGLSAALNLRERGYSVMLLEAERVGWGASGRSGGQILTSYACEMEPIEAQLGFEEAKRLWDMSVESVALVKEQIQRHHIDCDWLSGTSSAAIKPRQLRGLQEWHDDISGRYNYPHLEWKEGRDYDSVANSPQYIGGVVDTFAGHLHPLNYTLGLARAARDSGVEIFEKTRALSLQKGSTCVVTTESGSVRCKNLVLAGNAYLGKLEPALDSKIMPVGTYIVSTEVLGEDRLRKFLPGYHAIADANFVLDYFRPTGDHRLLFGGRVSYSGLQPPDLSSGLRRRMLKVFPGLSDVKIEHAWGGFVDITVNRAPHFGRLGNDPVYFAQGFSGHGMALTNLAGKVIAEAIDGDNSRLDVFSHLKHQNFPGGRLLRMPSLVLAMMYYRLRDLL
ncbi:NAD(P)/FAD-dependent oxidoreductase [Pokkaliibacter sp. CJK22405]|uniref:NAD(P)/FAD-dependent oxidoreductase n=1 Tax=Pokkaliibacter sp. CJK22405 TaxID=3384615 RepID=UPI003984F096